MRLLSHKSRGFAREYREARPSGGTRRRRPGDRCQDHRGHPGQGGCGPLRLHGKVRRSETDSGAASHLACRNPQCKHLAHPGSPEGPCLLAQQRHRLCQKEPQQGLVDEERRGGACRRALRSASPCRRLCSGGNRAARLHGHHDLRLCQGSGRARNRGRYPGWSRRNGRAGPACRP